MAKRELSSTLKNLKFMQRASQKVEKLEEKEQLITAGDFPSSSAPKRCVVIIEGEPHPGAARGRMSFLSFNPSIDKLNEEACDLSENGSMATSSGRQTETTSTRENTFPQDNLESDILIGDGDLKRKHPDLSYDLSYPNKSRKNSLDLLDSSPRGSHSSQKQKCEKLDWSVLRPPKHQNKKSVNMLAGITRLLENQADRPRQSHEENVAERFRKQGPKEFAGTTDPLVAEEWIQSLESIFAYMGLQHANRIRCAVFMLRGAAALWWAGASVGLTVAQMTWEEFRGVFFDKYFTADTRGQLIREFFQLQQRDKTVADYVLQFERGCRYVPSIGQVEAEKLRQFTSGLRPDIKHDVNMADVTTYQAAVNRAYRSERGRREIRADMERKRQFGQTGRGQSSQPPAKKAYGGTSHGPSQQRPQGQQRQQGGGGKQTAGSYPVCKTCQKQHPGPCLMGSNVCYFCKDPGHISTYCPKKKASTGRLFVMQAEEADPDASLITGEDDVDVVPTGGVDP